MTFPDGRKELPARWQVKRTKAFEDGVTAKATEILKENMTSGTGTTARIDCPAAGKTGTTDEFTDAWFVGFTPRLATAVWVGYPNDRTQMLGLYHGANVAGATFPSEIWNSYMSVAKGKFCGDFPPPKTPFQAAAVLRPLHDQRRRQGQPERGRRRSDRLAHADGPVRAHARCHARRHRRHQAGHRRHQAGRRRRRRQGLRPREVRGAAPTAARRRRQHGNGDGDGGGTQAPG